MGIPVWTRVTLTLRTFLEPSTTVSVSLPSSPYARAKRRREGADEATTEGDPGMDAGDADVEPVDVAGLDGELIVAVASLRAREASKRASHRARADEAATDGDPGWTRETLT